MLQRLFRGEAADAIATATETLDVAIEDAQAQRDALQAQYDAIYSQITELWTQADAIASQMYELDQAIGDAAEEIGGGAVTVQVYSRGDRSRRAEGDEDIRRQLEALDRQKGEVIRKMETLDQKWGTGDKDELERKRDEIDQDFAMYDELSDENDDLGEQMEQLFGEAPDIDESDFENY